MSDLIPVGAVPCACPVQGDHKGAPLRNNRPNVTLANYSQRDIVLNESLGSSGTDHAGRHSLATGMDGRVSRRASHRVTGALQKKETIAQAGDRFFSIRL